MARIDELMNFQLQSSSKSTAERGIRSESGRYDPLTVLGWQKHDTILVFGNSAFIPWLHQEGAMVWDAPRPREAEQFLKDGSKFNRIVIDRAVTFSQDHVLRAGALLEGPYGGPGQLIFFPKDDGSAFEFRSTVEFYYPTARVWNLDTTYGPVIIAEIGGKSWRMLNG